MNNALKIFVAITSWTFCAAAFLIYLVMGLFYLTPTSSLDEIILSPLKRLIKELYASTELFRWGVDTIPAARFTDVTHMANSLPVVLLVAVIIVWWAFWRPAFQDINRNHKAKLRVQKEEEEADIERRAARRRDKKDRD